MSNDQGSQFRKGSKPALFIQLAKPDDLGFSCPVPVTEFVGKYASLQFGNGGDWIRKDGSLSRYYNIRRHPEGRGKITHVELQGFRKVPVLEVFNKRMERWKKRLEKHHLDLKPSVFPTVTSVIILMENSARTHRKNMSVRQSRKG